MIVDGQEMTRDRDGSWIVPVEVHRCRGGWAGEDADGRPVPCARCKPHLTSSAPSRRAIR